MARIPKPSPDQLGLSAADLGIEPTDAEKRAEIGKKAIEAIDAGVVKDFPSAANAHLPDERRSDVLQETTGLSPLGGGIEGGFEDAIEKGLGVTQNNVQRALDLKGEHQGKHNANNPTPLTGVKATRADAAEAKAKFLAEQRAIDKAEKPTETSQDENTQLPKHKPAVERVKQPPKATWLETEMLKS